MSPSSRQAAEDMLHARSAEKSDGGWGESRESRESLPVGHAESNSACVWEVVRTDDDISHRYESSVRGQSSYTGFSNSLLDSDHRNMALHRQVSNREAETRSNGDALHLKASRLSPQFRGLLPVRKDMRRSVDSAIYEERAPMYSPDPAIIRPVYPSASFRGPRRTRIFAMRQSEPKMRASPANRRSLIRLIGGSRRASDVVYSTR